LFFWIIGVIELGVGFISRGEEIFEGRLEFSSVRVEEMLVFEFVDLKFELVIL
jgi:hypothetical protein